MTTPTLPKYGDTADAEALLVALVPTGTVPKSWQTGSASLTIGPYTVSHTADKSGSGVVVISWSVSVSVGTGIPGINVNGPTTSQSVEATWDTTGKLSAPIAQGAGTGPTSGGPGDVITSPSILAQVGTVLGDLLKVFTAGFWKRAGILLAGVAILIVALVLLLHHHAAPEGGS